MSNLWRQISNWPLWHIFGIYDGRSVLLGVLFLWFGVDALRTGEAWFTHGGWKKDEHPNMYQGIVVTQFLVGLIALLVGIFGLPPGAKP